jgi:hypothetical protein
MREDLAEVRRILEQRQAWESREAKRPLVNQNSYLNYTPQSSSTSLMLRRLAPSTSRAGICRECSGARSRSRPRSRTA